MRRESPYHLITAEEIVKIAEKAVNLGDVLLAVDVKNAWYAYRSTQKDWLINDNWEAMQMLGVVFFAGCVFGVRVLRHRKKTKKALRR